MIKDEAKQRSYLFLKPILRKQQLIRCNQYTLYVIQAKRTLCLLTNNHKTLLLSELLIMVAQLSD